MDGLVCAVHRRKNKGFPTLKRTLNLGIEKGRLLKNSRPKGGLIQVICYPASPETVDITGFIEKFCIAIRTMAEPERNLRPAPGLFLLPRRPRPMKDRSGQRSSHPRHSARFRIRPVSDGRQA